jgi:hypothetical protein
LSRERVLAEIALQWVEKPAKRHKKSVLDFSPTRSNYSLFLVGARGFEPHDRIEIIENLT